MELAPLHCHSEFSVRDSLLRITEIPVIAARLGWTACAITDHGAIEGVPAFMKAARAVGIRPIAGVELYVGCPDTYQGGKYRKEDRLHHVTVLAKNARGFSSILGLLSYAHKNHYDARRQRAVVPVSAVPERLTDCVVLSGCYGSPFWRGTDAALDDLALYAATFGEDFFLEVQPLYDWEEQIRLNRMIVEISESTGIPIVATPDCHYTPEDVRFHEALLAVANRRSIQDPGAWKFSTQQSRLICPKTFEEAVGRSGIPSRLVPRVLEAIGRVCERITDWSWDELPKPRLPVIPGDVKALVRQGLERHGLSGRPEYEERVAKELATFTAAGLDQYLLLVRRCVELFKGEGAEIGPRGSVGGSLVAYCLGITPLDPLVHGLSFERWFAPGRQGLPDADIDLDEETRERAPEILRREFGDGKVAQISNYTTFGFRLAIKDAARAYGVKIRDIPPGPEERDAKDVLDIPTGRELAQLSPDAVEFARKLVGRVRQFGAHAGGFVISEDPLTEGRSAIVRRGKDEALCWDMEIAEALGFVKLDFLGVDSLSAIKAIGREIGVDWKTVPLDDPVVYDDFSKGLTAAVPQFLSPLLRNALRLLRPKKFEDLVWANAAFRPGGLGQMSPEKLIASYKEDKDSLIVYQEDLMEVCVALAGFSWAEADSVRKIAAKSRGSEGFEELERWREPFVRGCVRLGSLSEKDANVLWTSLAGWARYGFNKSHSTAYSWNAYRVAWAKRHYPLETFTSLLNSEDNTGPIIDEAPEFGVKLFPVDPNKSDLVWVREGDGIRVPLTEVPGMDLRMAKRVIRERTKAPFSGEEDFRARLPKIPGAVVAELFSGRMPGQTFALPLLDPRRAIPKAQRQAIRDKVLSCDGVSYDCPLRVSCRRPVPLDIGKTNVLVVGKAPGQHEDMRGRPFVGPSGGLIDEALAENGIAHNELSWSNVCHCKLPFTEGADEEKICCPHLKDEVELLNPPLILALGKEAYRWFGGTLSITKAVGTVGVYRGAKVVVSLHPSYVLRDPSKRPDFDLAIRKFAELYHVLVPWDGVPLNLPLKGSQLLLARVRARARDLLRG